MNDRGKFGALLRVLRGDMSIRELEKISGISNTFICQLENGKVTNPTADVLKKLFKAFPNHRRQILESLELL